MALIEEWRSLRQKRQHQTQLRSTQVRETLTTFNVQRQLQSLQLHDRLSQERTHLAEESATRQANLQLYVLSLHQQIQNVLTLNAAQRAIAAEQVRQELQTFFIELKAQTQTQLEQAHQQRTESAAQLQQELSDFEAKLTADVQNLLQDYQLLRQCRASQVQQMLVQTRRARLAEAKALAENLTQLRSSRQQEYQTLKAQIWGDAQNEAPPEPVSPQLTAIPAKPATRSPVVKVIKVPHPSTKPQNLTPTLEEKVHNYIVRSPGARLTDIETHLAINRVQTVDALSSLIRKGSIVQRDRLYFPV